MKSLNPVEQFAVMLQQAKTFAEQKSLQAEPFKKTYDMLSLSLFYLEGKARISASALRDRVEGATQ